MHKREGRDTEYSSEKKNPYKQFPIRIEVSKLVF